MRTIGYRNHEINVFFWGGGEGFEQTYETRSIVIILVGVWMVMFRLMVFNATYNKHESREKTTDLPQVTDKLYHIIL